MRRLKRILVGCLCVALLAGVGAGAVQWLRSGNLPPVLWSTDNTTFQTVAQSADTPSATREAPVRIEVQVERLYGLHIGTPVRVRYIVNTLSSTKVRFDTLFRGVLSRYTTTWRLYPGTQPVVVSEIKKDGFTTRVIELTVAVWESPAPPQPKTPTAEQPPAPPPSADQDTDSEGGEVVQPAAAAPMPAASTKPELWPLSVEFLYSTDKMPNGLDKWAYIETPEIKFGFSSLLDPGMDTKQPPPAVDTYDMGPIGDMPDTYNPLGVALIGIGAVGSAVGLVYLVTLFVGWVRRRRVAAATLPAEIVSFRAAMQKADDTRDIRPYVEQLHIAVRDRLGGAQVPDSVLVQLWSGHPLYDRIVKTLSVLNAAVHAGRIDSYNENQVSRLIADLDAHQLAKRAGLVSRLVRAPIRATARLFSWLRRGRSRRQA